MSIVQGVKDLLKSNERKAELIRLQELLKDKKAKGIIVSRPSVVPNLQDAEQHSRDILFRNRASESA